MVSPCGGRPSSSDGAAAPGSRHRDGRGRYRSGRLDHEVIAAASGIRRDLEPRRARGGGQVRLRLAPAEQHHLSR